MKTKVFFLFLLFIFLVCITKDYKTRRLEHLNWIIGKWEITSSKEVIFEEWKKSSDNYFMGISYSINEEETIVFETIKIEERNNSLYYIPSVKDQNNGLPVLFKLIKQNPSSSAFENASHDFPQQIKYELLENDLIKATISGKVDGEFRKKEFIMQKVKGD